MHELGITQNIVAIAAEYANGMPVKRVTLEVGKLTAILPDAIRFCFDVCCQGTLLDGAQLEIIEKAGLARCRQCGFEVPLDLPFGVCTCGSQDLQIIQGEELSIKELETEEVCV
jgi:hydrogenase nickel incorporation protein HypA/HybF